MKDSVRITKTKGGRVRIRASGKAADALFRLLTNKLDKEPKPAPPQQPTGSREGSGHE